MICFDIYFWWKGWEKVADMYYYQKDGQCSVYPPTPSRGWVIICNLKPAFTPRDFRAVRAFLKTGGWV